MSKKWNNNELKIFITIKIGRKNREYDEKYVEKSTKNIHILFPKVREGGRTVGSGRVITIIK